MTGVVTEIVVVHTMHDPEKGPTDTFWMGPKNPWSWGPIEDAARFPDRETAYESWCEAGRLNVVWCSPDMGCREVHRAPYVEIDTITEYGKTSRLSRSIRVF